MKDTEALRATKDLIESEELSGRDLQILKYMLDDLSLDQITKKLGIGRVTLWKSTSSSHFKRALRQAQESILLSALAALSGNSRAMSLVLLDIALDESQTASNRIQAIKLSLNSIQVIATSAEFADRLEALELAIENL